MWRYFVAVDLFCIVSSKILGQNEIIDSFHPTFPNEHIIYSSTYNITSVLVPIIGMNYVTTDSTESPSVFFTAVDPVFNGGSCIFVLEGLAAYEILEGGRDATADYSFDKAIYLGGKDGLYKYDIASRSAKKYGMFKDDIIQLQKANGSDTIYILDSDRKIFKIEKNGKIKTKISMISCATEFVLDTANNIYYINCADLMIHIVLSDKSVPSLTASVLEDFKSIKLMRPALIMDKCVPFFGDGVLHIVYSNSKIEKKNFQLKEIPSAISVDTALYLVAAYKGKIYEFNVLDVLTETMFKMGKKAPTSSMTDIVMSVFGTVNHRLYPM